MKRHPQHIQPISDRKAQLIDEQKKQTEAMIKVVEQLTADGVIDAECARIARQKLKEASMWSETR